MNERLRKLLLYQKYITWMIEWELHGANRQRYEREWKKGRQPAPKSDAGRNECKVQERSD